MVGQSQMFIRLLAGKLHEMSALFDKTFYKSKLAVTIECDLGEEVRASLKKLKRYFSKGKKASVTAVRNLHAFHYDISQVDTGLEQLGPKMTLDIYFDDKSANTFYGFADSIINSAVMAAIDEESHAKAFETLLHDIEDITKSFQSILEEIMAKIIRRYLSNRFVKAEVVHEEVRSTDWNQITLPTFVENPRPWSMTLQNGKVLSWGGQRVEGPMFLRALLDS